MEVKSKYDIDSEAISELVVWAVRYGLGRMTYVSYSIPQAVMTLIDRIEDKDIKCMIRDIESHKDTHGKIGMECDEQNWIHFKNKLQMELEKRNKSK